jgi:hypothetical protein
MTLPDSVLAEHARAIHELAKRTREDIIAIGRHLTEAREHVGHGAWLDWITAEFGWSDQTARRFIHVYELSRDSKFNTLVELELPLGVLYRLAAPKSEAAREEIAARIEAGDNPSCAAVTTVIAQTKTKTKTKTKKSSTSTAKLTAVAPAWGSKEQSIEERRALMAALAAEPADSPTPESTNGAAIPVVPSVVPKSSTVLVEFFARASGADIYDRIPAARLDEVCRAFLDRLTVDGMRMRMSDEFGRQLRARLPAPKKNGSKKSNKPKFKTMQMTKTVDASGKTIYAHARGNGSRSAAEKRISRR